MALRDGNAAVKALGELGVLTLCPSPELLFGRLEFSVGCVIGPARLVPLAGVYKLSESFWGKPFLVNGLGVGAWYDLTGCRDELLEVVAADLFRGEARHV
jgi:hypothetical protein